MWQNRGGYRLLEVELGFSPSYSLAIGPLLGDGTLQCAALDPTGSLLKVVGHDGSLLWSAEVANHDRLGVTPVVIADVDADGECEVVIGEHPEGENNVLIFDRTGSVKRRVKLPLGTEDDTGTAVDSLVLADIDGDGRKELVVAVNGGCIYGLDPSGGIILEVRGLPPFFEHFLHAGDIDGDGCDELFISGGAAIGSDSPTNHPLFFALDHDGTTLWARAIQEIGPDGHVDQAIIKDFDGSGEATVFSATGGCLLNRCGQELWSVRDIIHHGQWADSRKVRHDRTGDQILLSELWDWRYGMLLLNNDGEVLWTYDGLTEGSYPTHARLIDWRGDGVQYAILGEQPRREFEEPVDLKIVLLDPMGEVALAVPFRDVRREGWLYCSENRATVGDVDGDGREEFVFHRTDGTLMIVGAR